MRRTLALLPLLLLLSALVWARGPRKSDGPRTDGTAGAICRWGESPGDDPRLLRPPPRSCRKGLSCCAAGGVASSDSICMKVTHCPNYP